MVFITGKGKTSENGEKGDFRRRKKRRCFEGDVGGAEPGDTGSDSGPYPRGGAAADHSSGMQIMVVGRRRTLLLVGDRRRGLVPPLEMLRQSRLAGPQTRAP